MIVKRLNARNDVCSCNFCDKGELSKSQRGLVYPYAHVVMFRRESNGIQVCICYDCLNELNGKAALINSDQ